LNQVPTTAAFQIGLDAEDLDEVERGEIEVF